MSTITLKQLNEFAKRAGVSDNVKIYTCGASVDFMVAYRDTCNGNMFEEILLDECTLTCEDVISDEVDNRKILRVYDRYDGEYSDFKCCSTCKRCNVNGTRNPETGYCSYHKEEVDLVEEACDEFKWR